MPSTFRAPFFELSYHYAHTVNPAANESIGLEMSADDASCGWMY